MSANNFYYVNTSKLFYKNGYNEPEEEEDGDDVYYWDENDVDLFEEYLVEVLDKNFKYDNNIYRANQWDRLYKLNDKPPARYTNSSFENRNYPSTFITTYSYSFEIKTDDDISSGVDINFNIYIRAGYYYGASLDWELVLIHEIGEDTYNKKEHGTIESFATRFMDITSTWNEKEYSYNSEDVEKYTNLLTKEIYRGIGRIEKSFKQVSDN
jgi:hypothetical protein